MTHEEKEQMLERMTRALKVAKKRRRTDKIMTIAGLGECFYGDGEFSSINKAVQIISDRGFDKRKIPNYVLFEGIDLQAVLREGQHKRPSTRALRAYRDRKNDSGRQM